MPETLVQFQTPIVAPDDTVYSARACGAAASDGLWQGWLEFTPVDGGDTVRSGRETTQPNRADTLYWATGLSPVYLEGALKRALDGPVTVVVPGLEPPVFDGPAAPVVVSRGAPEAPARAVLDPFSVFQKGEALLRKQLAALSAWHLVNIVVEYELSDESAAALSRLPHAALAELIVSGVRQHAGVEPPARSSVRPR